MLALHYGPGDVNAWAAPLLNEGLAVAYQVDPIRGDMTPRWNNRHIHDVSASWRRQGRSFVRLLLDPQGGVAPIKALFARSAAGNPVDTTRRNIETVYGKSLEALEAEWHAVHDAR